MRAFAILAVAAVAAVALGGCGDLGMNRQAKYPPQAPAALFANGSEAQAAPAGTVALGAPERDALALSPPPITLALVERGRERHRIACTPCHGERGDGDGAAVQRGFPAPRSYEDPHFRALSGQAIYAAITEGYGQMYPQAERVTPQDRWAIVAYIRALQLASPPTSPAPAGAQP